MKKIIIIGAGVSGLSTGVYGRLNGFETEIYEMHNKPGGECTGWKRGDYYFDGCIHWLMGSKSGTPLNKIWREVGALDDSVTIINNEFLYSYEENGQRVYIYRDISRLEQQLKELSPKDSDMISDLCRAARAMKVMEMPTEKPLDKNNLLDMAKMMLNMRPALKYLARFEQMTVGELTEKFKSPLLRKALSMLIPAQYKATALISTLSSLDNGDSGWPVGGSKAFAKRMEMRYKELGGAINYKAKVHRILVQNNRAVGIVMEDGSIHKGEYIISSADGFATIFEMLEGKYLDDKIGTIYSDQETYPTYTSVQVSLGINCELNDRPHLLYVKLEKAIDGGGIENSYIGLRHFGYDSTLNPAGKSTVTVMLYADFDWWNSKYKDNEVYIQEKERLATEVKNVVETNYPETRGKIDVIV